MSWERKKLKVKQPGIEEEDMMSQHLDTVATSTLNQKQSRQQLARRKRSRQLQFKKEGHDISQRSDSNSEDKMSRHHLVVVTVIALKRGRDIIQLSRQQIHRREGRDNTWLSRHQLRRLEVATTSDCRDNNCTKRK